MTAIKGPWVYIIVAAAGGLTGLAVAGLPAEVPSDLVIVEQPAAVTPPPVSAVPTATVQDTPAEATDVTAIETSVPESPSTND